MQSNKQFSLLLLGAALLQIGLARPAIASKEGGLSLHDVTLDSPGMDDSGPVHVEIRRSDDGIEKLVVSAFGKTEAASPQLLQSILEKKWLNGVQLSWSKGSRLTGGKTVYVSLTEGGSWGVVIVAIIGFDEEGNFRVVENLSREQVEERAAKTATD